MTKEERTQKQSGEKNYEKNIEVEAEGNDDHAKLENASNDESKDEKSNEDGDPKSIIFKEDLAEDIMLMYIVDHPKFVFGITEDMLVKNVKNEKNEQLSDKEIKTTSGYHYLKELVIETAWQNQRKRGWVKYALKKKNVFGVF